MTFYCEFSFQIIIHQYFLKYLKTTSTYLNPEDILN